MHTLVDGWFVRAQVGIDMIPVDCVTIQQMDTHGSVVCPKTFSKFEIFHLALLLLNIMIFWVALMMWMMNIKLLDIRIFYAIL